MQFFLKFAGMLSSSSYASLKLARAVAEREKLMASLRESKERLEETDRRKDEFIAVLSHELRNPLAPIRTSLHLLERADPAGPQAARARAVMNRQVRHLTRLVDDLLDVTRISHGKIVLSRERIDLRDVVRRTCDDGRAAFEERAIGLAVELPPGPVPVDADPTRVAQVVGNLVQNAAKFTPSGGRVVVAVTSGDGRAEVAVRDTGVGLHASELERVFEPFTQAEQGLARTHGGLGLGLALVKSLVALHGGSVEARSEGPGRGAEFVIRLPLAPPASPRT
jgi:signal transduction histidine kinase